MPRIASVVLLLLFGTLPALMAQQAAAHERIATVTAGLGNTMGWLGVQGERYFAHERLSAFVGIGYTPVRDSGDPSGPTFAAGFRGFTPGVRHRGFLALCVAQLAVQAGTDDPGRFYGPGVELGYQFASLGGFTAMLGAGVGYAPTIPDGESSTGAMLELGFGYTWRR